MRSNVPAAHRRLLVVTAAMSYLLVALGSVVCITNSSGGCPDWPLCHGRLIPPPRLDSILEYSHRIAALTTGPLILGAAIAGWRGRRRSLRILPTVAVVLTGAVAVFGAFAVLTGLPPVLASIDLASALGVLTLMLVSAAAAVAARAPAAPDRSPGRRLLARLSVAALGGLFVFLIAGVLLAEGSTMRCVGGPLQGAAGPLTTARTVLGAAVAILVGLAAVTALHDPRTDRATRVWAVLAAAAVSVEVVLALALLRRPFEPSLLIASAVATASLWAALVLVAARTALVSREPASSPGVPGV